MQALDPPEKANELPQMPGICDAAVGTPLDQRSGFHSLASSPHISSLRENAKNGKKIESPAVTLYRE